jgi:trans-aconitate 2-methyltransferase
MREIMTWSAAQYAKFEDERTRPARDLLGALEVEQVATAVDLGCGPGNSTELLKARFPNAALTAIDKSVEMIDAARGRLPSVDFRVGDISEWDEAGPFDLVFANASLQWVPDHASLLPRLLLKISPGGSLAMQVPDNLDEPAHKAMREIASQGPWSSKLSSALVVREPRHGADWYYNLFSNHPVKLSIWRTTYFHRLTGGAVDIVEWFRGTGLRPFLDPLDPAERVSFTERFREMVDEAYPALADDSVLLPFPRLFLIARR